MFEQFTDQARRVVVLAQEESRELRHAHIGTEHLLLGLLRDDSDSTEHALAAAGVTSANVRQQLERTVGRGRKEPGGHIPFTPRAKQALEAALRASQRLGHAHMGPPHLLRGLLDVPDGMAARILTDLNVDVEHLAATADSLADGGEAPLPSQVHVRAVGVPAGPKGWMTARRRRPGGEDVAALARRNDELLTALRRYGRHEDGCDPDRGCTCGLGPLLAGDA
jgi:ATP-dependent Clp protease ATP-binding subunit ClpA